MRIHSERDFLRLVDVVPRDLAVAVLVVERVGAQTRELAAKVLHLLLQGRVHGAQLAVLHFDVLDVLLLLRATLGSCEPVLLAIFLLFIAAFAIFFISIYKIASFAVLPHPLGLRMSLICGITSAFRLVGLCSFGGIYHCAFRARVFRIGESVYTIIWRCNLAKLLLGTPSALHDLLHGVYVWKSGTEAAATGALVVPHMHGVERVPENATLMR